MLLMEMALLGAVLLVAFVNGANDNMKGVATLYGAGVASYGRALALATVSTGLGSLASLALASALVRIFSAKGIVPDGLVDTALLTAVAVAAALTVLLATCLGFPVSTTHALVGGLAGAGFVRAGAELDLGALGGAVALPLVAGPLLGVALAGIGFRASKSASKGLLGARAPSDATCVCVDEARPAIADSARSLAAVAMTRSAALSVEVDDAAACERRGSGSVARVDTRSLVDGAHFVSAGLVGFARGLNDTPKILGLLVGAALVSPIGGVLAITAAMALGGLVAARRVAVTMAQRITPMTPGQGLIANLSTALLVIGASRFGLPVSTTHVATGGIVGIGQSGGALCRRVALQILAAWLTTLPLAAALGALAMGVLR